jgi:hypothetical protein
MRSGPLVGDARGGLRTWSLTDAGPLTFVATAALVSQPTSFVVARSGSRQTAADGGRTVDSPAAVAGLDAPSRAAGRELVMGW